VKNIAPKYKRVFLMLRGSDRRKFPMGLMAGLCITWGGLGIKGARILHAQQSSRNIDEVGREDYFSYFWVLVSISSWFSVLFMARGMGS
jgi:hypothetical protein